MLTWQVSFSFFLNLEKLCITLVHNKHCAIYAQNMVYCNFSHWGRLCIMHRWSLNNCPPVKEFGFRDAGNFCLWNLESWVLESVIQLKRSGILDFGIWNPLTTGIRNPGFWNLEYSSRDPESNNDWNLEYISRNPESKNKERKERIRNPVARIRNPWRIPKSKTVSSSLTWGENIPRLSSCSKVIWNNAIMKNQTFTSIFFFWQFILRKVLLKIFYITPIPHFVVQISIYTTSPRTFNNISHALYTLFTDTVPSQFSNPETFSTAHD